MDAADALDFKTRKEWRDWLRKNHRKSNGVWLVHYKRNAEDPGINHEEALEEALCFGWIDSKMRSVDDQRFVQRYTPRKASSIWSAANRRRAESLTRAGRMTAEGLARVDDAKRTGAWHRAYTSTDPQEMPGDLRSALRKDIVALHNFEAFSRSHQFIYIHWINEAKRSDTRKRRIMQVVRRSAQNKRPALRAGERLNRIP